MVGAIVPWNFPFEVTIHKLGQALATGNTVVLKPAPNTPFNATRLGRLIAENTDIPAGCRQCRHGVGPLRRRGTHALAEGRPDLLHRLHGGRQADHGEGRRDDEAALPRTRRQVGDDRAGGRRLRTGLSDRHRAAACTPARAARNPTRMLLPRSRYDEGVAILQGRSTRTSRRATRRIPAPLCGPVISAKQQQPHPRLHPEGCRRGRHPAGRRHRAARRSSTRDSSSSQRFSPTSTTR